MNAWQWTARILAGALALAIAGTAAARGASSADGDWRFRGTLYLWVPGVSGETQYPPPADGGVSVGIDSEDVLRALQMVFMGGLEARKGRYGALTDFIYMDFDAGKAGTRDLTLSGPGGSIEIPVGASADVNLRLRGWAWNIAGTYAWIETPRYEVHALAGARYLKIETTFDWNFTGNVGALPPAALAGSSASAPQVWDAIVGAKGRLQLGDGRWYAPYYADIGTGQSELTWQALAGIGYAFSWGELAAVYRHIDYTFSDSPAKNLRFSGWAAGATFRW
jgi:hypothetical protein